jgi:UDP-N-acetyl-2-amino-2-deoxyglucuronate dehydrogenase
VKAALDAGRFGRLVLCSAYVKWHRTAEYYRGWKGTLALDGGGALINQAIHAHRWPTPTRWLISWTRP